MTQTDARLRLDDGRLSVPAREISAIAARFRAAMADGLAGRPSSLKMLPSYLGRPDGRESGSYIALDFGGTNVRVQVVGLGGGRWRVCRQSAAPLRDPAGGYDHTSAASSAEQLFDFIARQIAATIDGQGDYPLGHTFSFPSRQSDVGHAVLIGWTKEIKTPGVEGHEIGALLGAALARQGITRIKPCAIINDTVGTLLTAAYADPRADIGAICGTGHNTCYFERRLGMIVNMESGNFDALPISAYDDALDRASERPGTQRLEKMVAGRYLGELVRLIAQEHGLYDGPPYSLAAEQLAGWLAEDGAAHHPVLRKAARLIVLRAARLVAASFIGVLGHLDPELADSHTIAVDGSLYERMPGYAAAMTACLQETLGEKAAQVRLRLTKDGSGIGAAIAAAIAARSC